MVRFASPPAAQMPRWTVCLTTGDVLVGDALTLDAGRLTLASAALGKVQFPMTLVAAIQQGQQRSGFLGRQWLADWDRMSYANQFFNDLPTAYRDVQLPDRVAVDLTLPTAAKVKPTHAHIRIFCDPRDPSVNRWDTGYSATLNRTTGVQLSGVHGWSKTVSLASPRPSVTLGLRIDRKTGEALVLVDGEVKQREMLRPLADNYKRGLLIRTDELPDFVMVRSWPKDAEKPASWMQLANGDMMEGTLESISADTAVLMTADVGRLEVPVERLTSASLDTTFRGEVALRDGSVAVGLSGGGNVIGTATEVTATGLTLDCAWGTKLTIPLAAMTWLRWGLDKPLSLKEASKPSS